MHDLADLITQLACQAQERTSPCDVVCGCVESLDPLIISLAGAQIKLLRRVNEPELKEGDAVLLLRLHGGQRFLILDKAVKQ